jgi:hypothetical protein
VRDAISVVVGWGYACAVRRDHSVACGGLHSRYARGKPDDGREVRAVAGVHDAAQVVLGLDHACALSTVGDVACWGYNLHGEVGASDADVPADGIVHVRGLGRPVELAAGSFHTCARDDHGALRCFGLNAHGELGDGTTRTSLEPVTVDLRGVEQVVADAFHTCARLADTTVRCWGQRLPIDYEPAPAQPAITFRPADAGPPLQPWQLPAVVRPLEVRGLRGAVEIGVGSESLCGRMPGGAVLCAGGNGLSQLGRSTFFRGSPAAFEPVEGLGPEVDGGGGGLASIAALSVHEQQACVLLRDTRVRCWGYDVYGSLGVGSDETVRRPAFVLR